MPPSRHSQAQEQTPYPTQNPRHPPLPNTAPDNDYPPTHCRDCQGYLQLRQSLQIPPNRALFLTHLALTTHSYHTAMAPISAVPHTLAQHIRSNLGSTQDSRYRLRSTSGGSATGNQARRGDRAGKLTPGCGEGEGAAQPAGAETRSRNSGRRRALITDYSDDEEREATAPTLNQQRIIKGKALPSHDYDIDMLQLKDLSPEHGGSSLQLSSFHNEYAAIPNQAAVSIIRLDVINLADATPTTSHKSPRKGNHIRHPKC